MSEQPPEDDLEPKIGPPTIDEVIAYFGAELQNAKREDVVTAWRAEKSHQRSVCKRHLVADDVEWPDALREALCRRVMHNLALRKLPLGVQADVTETTVATTRVGGTDAEVKRLEAPHRKRVVG